MPLVWRAAGGVHGYSAEDTTNYYVVTITVSQFVTCHLLWDIGLDIREGAFSSMLLRPLSHLSVSFSRNVAWRVGKLALFVPFLLVLIPFYGNANFGSLQMDCIFLIALILGQTLAFLAAYSVAMLAMWTTEFVSLFQLYYFPELIFSGRVVPLTSLPDWAQSASQFLHFRYTVSFPAEILLGRLSLNQITVGLAIQLGWIILFFGLSRILFNLGVKKYSGFGM